MFQKKKKKKRSYANSHQAHIYGDNEDLLRKWFAANREKRKNIFLATKFGVEPLPDGSRKVDTSAAYTKKSLEKSLQRLGLPYVDLFYAHRVNPETPIEETVQTMAELKKEGKIKNLGLSEVSSETLRRACKVHHIAAVQIEYSPFTLDIESDQIGLLKTARELGVAIVAYSPLGRGMLSGIRSRDDFEEGDYRKFAPRFSEENFPKNLKLVDQIDSLAALKHVTPSQLTLAWLLAEGDDIFPIPGTTRVEKLIENIDSFKVKLSPDELKQFRKYVDDAEVHGTRYPPIRLNQLFADTVPLK